MVASTAREVRVATVTDVPPGAVHPVDADGRALVVVNLGGTLVALDGTCGHAGGPLGEGEVVDDCRLRCPWHGATYDLRTGAACAGPARKPLARYAVRVDGDAVLVTLGRPADPCRGQRRRTTPTGR